MATMSGNHYLPKPDRVSENHILRGAVGIELYYGTVISAEEGKNPGLQTVLDNAKNAKAWGALLGTNLSDHTKSDYFKASRRERTEPELQECDDRRYGHQGYSFTSSTCSII